MCNFEKHIDLEYWVGTLKRRNVRFNSIIVHNHLRNPLPHSRFVGRAELIDELSKVDIKQLSQFDEKCRNELCLAFRSCGSRFDDNPTPCHISARQFDNRNQTLNECDVKIGAQKQDKKTHVVHPIDDQGHLKDCGVLGGMMRAVGCPLRDSCMNGWDDIAEHGKMREKNFVCLGDCRWPSLWSAELPVEGVVVDSVECLETLEDENPINRMLEKVPTRLTSPKTFSPFSLGDSALRFATVPNCKQ